MSTISSSDIHKIHDQLEYHKTQPGALLPILHEAQEELIYLPPEVVPMIATTLNQSNTEIHGVINFHHHFLDHKPGLNKIQYAASICRVASCQAMSYSGSEQGIKQRLDVDYHQTTKM
jgi:formate dehydrogenase subunit gamma